MAELNKKDSFKELSEEGQALYDANKPDEAIKLYKTALIMTKNPDETELSGLYIQLGNAYFKLNDKDKYAYYYEEYLKLHPQGQSSVFSRLAQAYYYISPDKCIDYHNKALNLNIAKYNSYCKIFDMTKTPSYSQEDIKNEAEYEAEQIKNVFYPNLKKYTHENKKIPNKKLNIAYLSSDCHTHTMMNYILPLWENHNTNEFNFFIFNGSPKSDSTTKKIEKLEGFEVIKIGEIEAYDLAKLIYEKDIDILIDLSGYTHSKSYCLFYKPAPVIISYLGYLNTMGIKEIDYILTDKFGIPENIAPLYTEKPLYLDSDYYIFRGNNIPSSTEEAPFKKNGYITFGSFNCTSKINDATIYIWAKLLEKNPDSKLLIYRTQLTKGVIKHIKQQFEKRGICLDRIIFKKDKCNPHYKAYSLCDIALDPYPFSGMSIAIEAAIMGVPTVTMYGEGIQSRGAARINNVLGFKDELNAQYGEEYIEKATALAFDKEKLDNIKKSLRDKVYTSNFSKRNFITFAQDVEDKYKKAWNDFVDGK